MDQDDKCDLTCELLFFDTFSHESDQESSLDLVQFPSPIIIDEIRIIPLGARVEADFPGGVRLGATNPSSFEVTFYINDFTKPTVCTFSDFGRFAYKQNNIQFIPEERKPTDGLLIKGSYRTLTLAIFGSQTNVKDIIAKEETPSTESVPDPSLVLPEPVSVHRDDEISFGKNYNRKDSPVLDAEFKPVLERLIQTACENQQGNLLKSSSGSKTTDNDYYRERTKESFIVVRDPDLSSSSVNNRDENLDPRKRVKSSPSRRLTVNSLHSLSPVRSPQSFKSPISPQSDISLKYESNIPDPRSPIMDQRKSTSSRSPFSRHRTSSPPPPVHSNHSPRSPRSPRYIQSRSTSPWYKNQHNPSHPSSPTSPLSPHQYLKTRSPSAKTPPEDLSPSCSPLFKKRHRHTLSPSPTSRVLEVENDSNNSHSVPILPVNTDLLEEISPEHSLSDWAESISDDENLDDIESGDGEPDDTIQSNTDPLNNVNKSNNNFYIQSPNHQASESQEPEPFESISSEEEYFEEANLEETDRLSNYSDYDCDFALNATFDPFNWEFSPIRMIREPSLTNYQHLRISKQVNLYEEKRTLLLTQLTSIESRSASWIETMENLAKEMDLLPLDRMEILNSILLWVQDGLNYDLSSRQTTIPHKMRQLKAALKLCIALFNTDDPIVNKLIELKIPLQLMALYYKPDMSLPLKLLILRTFDGLCDSVIGTEHVLNDSYDFTDILPHDDNFSEEEDLKKSLTCYQSFLILLTTKPPSRIAISLEALFRKIHFYHLLQSFKSVTNQPDLDAPSILTHLRKIGSIFVSARKLLTQKIRCLPVSCFFEINEPKSDCFLSIYCWLNHHQFLDNLVLLLKSPLSGLLTSEVNQLLACMISEESFPRFLLSGACYSKTNQLISLLTQSNHLDDLYNQPCFIGDRLCYSLRSYSLVDSLIGRLNSDSFDLQKCDEDVELCTIFRNLHDLLDSPIGRECVVRTLSSSNYFHISLLPFLTSELQRRDTNDRRLYKSMITDYPVKLCLSMVQLGEDNVLHILKNHGNTLLSLSKNNQLPKLSSLSEWLKPMDCMQNFSYSEAAFKELMITLKTYAEGAIKLKENEIFKLQPQLITISRILYKLCIPTTNHSSSFYPHLPSETERSAKELKYYYATIQVYSYDGLSSLLTLLQKLSQTYLRPSHQSYVLVGDQGSMVMAFVKPSVKLVKEMIRILIAARSKDFRDTSPIAGMLRLYSLMYMFPRSSLVYSTSRETLRDIVDILMFYTQLSLTLSETDGEALSKSVWTKMISEVLQYTFSLPMTFVHGLSLLSELLPLPLPFQTQSPLTEDEVNKMINIRKLWSAHLLGLSSELEKLISNFVISSSPIIQQLLRRVCIQISDLSSPASTMMVRSVLEVILDSLPNDHHPRLSPSLPYVLNLLSYLTSHPPFKMAFIHTMHIGGKLDEKYFTIVNKLLRLLREDTSKLIEVQVNHLIFAFLQSLCDSDIYLNSRISSLSGLQILSNSLPPREALKLIIAMLLKFLRNTFRSSQSSSTAPDPSTILTSFSSPNEPKPFSTSFNSILPLVRILSLLCPHDFGFIPLKQGIFEETPTLITTILTQISDSIRLGNFKEQESHFNATIGGLLDFLKAFILETEHRAHKLSNKEIILLLSWQTRSECVTDMKPSQLNSLTSSSIKVDDEYQKQLNSPSKTEEKVIQVENHAEDHQPHVIKEETPDQATVEMKEKTESDSEPMEKSTNGIINGGEEEIKVQSCEDKNDISRHPLLVLDDYLQTLLTTHETEARSMQSTVKSLLHLLSSIEETCVEPAMNIELPVIDPLSLQFSKRQVYIVTDNIDLEKLNPNFWLSVPTSEDDHQSNQQQSTSTTNSNTGIHCVNPLNQSYRPYDLASIEEKRISFIELCQKYLPGEFNLKKTLENLCQIQEDESDVPNPTNKPLTSSNLVNQTNRRMASLLPSRESKSFSNVKKSFVAPIRNRGFGRPMMHSSRANDPFRSRPPNTSRPPSMHVDDFVALEQSGTNCNSYEAPNKRMKLDYTMKIRNSSSGNGGGNGNNSSNSNNNLSHNSSSSSRSFGGTSSLPSRSSPSYHSIDHHSTRRTLISSSHSHSHSHPSPLRNNVSSTPRSTISRYSRDSYSPPASRIPRSDSMGTSSSSQHWTKSNLTNRRDSRDSRDSRSVRSSTNR